MTVSLNKIHVCARSATFASKGRSSRPKLMESVVAFLVQPSDRHVVTDTRFRVVLPNSRSNATKANFIGTFVSRVRERVDVDMNREPCQ
jgi:hypothetical protein